MEKEPFVDETTAAKYLAVSVRYLRDLRRAGRIPGHALGCGGKCRVWRYRLSELEKSLIENAANSAEPSERRTNEGWDILES